MPLLKKIYLDDYSYKTLNIKDTGMTLSQLKNNVLPSKVCLPPRLS